MKLHLDKAQVLNTVTAYEADYVEVNAQRYPHSILLMPSGPVGIWPLTTFSSLSAEDFRAMLGHKPELVILGTGGKQRFAHPKLWAELAAQRIGVEFMDTGAACRTYNILMAEGRQVLAALLLETALQ
jgi:uncharacterized protein